MSYLPSVSGDTNIKASVLKAGSPTSVSVGGRWTISGTVNGQASLSSNRIILKPGRSYYLEGSVLVENTNKNGDIVWQWYDNTNGVYLGAEGYMNFATSFGAVTRVGRRVASVLVLHSDLTANIELELRIKSLSGSNWDMSINSVGIGSKNYAGYPSIRLLEIKP
jgi:hypothetical protein